GITAARSPAGSAGGERKAGAPRDLQGDRIASIAFQSGQTERTLSRRNGAARRFIRLFRSGWEIAFARRVQPLVREPRQYYGCPRPSRFSYHQSTAERALPDRSGPAGVTTDGRTYRGSRRRCALVR